jgi:hypothetical protein
MMRAFRWKRWRSPSKGEWRRNETYPDYIGGAAGPHLTAASERAGVRFLEFFVAKIRNPDTRRAYAQAADEFPAWCTAAGVPSIAASSRCT